MSGHREKTPTKNNTDRRYRGQQTYKRVINVKMKKIVQPPAN